MVVEWVVAATVLVSAISLVGLLLLLMSKAHQKQAVFLLVSFATGAFLGAAFFELLPEAVESLDSRAVFAASLLGMLVLFVMEKFIAWHHRHVLNEKKPVGYLVLAGDSLHNFFDGVAIAAAFLAGIPVGLATTLAVALHEIPQEWGDFALLLHSGFSARAALLFNLLSALFAVLGGLAFLYAAPSVQGLSSMGLGLGAGMFIYIAGSDLMPEFRRELEPKKSLVQLALILLGILMVWLLTGYLSE
jgi:zinc and cadmium transporter